MNKKNNIRNPLLWLVCLSVILCSGSAFAASLTVKIRQINPNGAVQQVTCAENTRCPVPVTIQTAGKTDTVTVNITFVKETLLAEFQTAKGFLYSANNLTDKNALYETIWHSALPKDKASTADVTLYLPAVRLAPSAPMLGVAKEAAAKVSHQAVATLEITVQRGP